MRALRRIGGWLYDRGGLAPVHRFLREHRVPPEVGRTRKGWYYVFGQALVFVFLAQVVTGTALAMKYIPAPDHAWESLRFLNDEVVWGGFLRALHFFGASAMVLLVFVHMARVFLTGSYKFPREMNWITGVVLLALVLAMAFTGQLLRWDQDGVSTVTVAATIAGRVPFLGETLMNLILAGETLGGATLSRFFVLHVILFPLAILGFIGWHVYLVVRHGVSEPPRAGRPVDRRTYREWYEEHKAKGRTLYWPDAAWREFVFVGVVYASIFGLALLYGPKGPGRIPDPALLETAPVPDWFFLWYYSLTWYKPVLLDELVLVWFPVLVFPLLMLLPVVFRSGERAPSRRPWALFTVVATFLLWAGLTAFGLRPYWIPDFDTRPLPGTALVAAPDEVREGAELFHERGCQYCHVALGRGGEYGPDLSASALRLSPEEIAVRILLGVRNMPAYREILAPGELDRIVSYIRWTALEAPAGARPPSPPDAPGANGAPEVPE